MRLQLNNFSKGLWILDGKETTMEGFVRRATGAHELRTPTLRSRAGMSDTTYTHTEDVRNIISLNNRFYHSNYDGATYKFYRDDTGVSIRTLNSAPNAMFKLPPQGGQNDYLFVVDGSNSFKVDSSSVVTNWGIVKPASGPTLADNGAGAMAAGTYFYAVTYRNTTTGSRSNPVLAGSIVLAANRQVRLTVIPTSADTQVNDREIWRTTAGGARYFKVGDIADNVTTTYNDNTADAALQSLELQFDNLSPFSDFFLLDAWTTNDRRVWWIGNGVFSGSNVVLYSPPGRPESVRGFIFVGSTDETLMKGISWNGANWVFSKKRIFRIFGEDEPFIAVPIDGTTGLDSETGIAITPYGLAYVSPDGLYLFDGSRSVLIGFDEISPFFRGETQEGLSPFVPGFRTCLFYHNQQLFLSQPGLSPEQTLVYSFRSQSWRNLGVRLSCGYVYGAFVTAGVLGKIATIEYFNDPSVSIQDMSTAIPIEWEIGGALTDLAHYGTIQRVYLDINTRTETVTVELVVDGVVVSLGTATTSDARTLLEFPVPSNWQTRVFSVRLTGSISHRVELFMLGVDVKLEGSNKEIGVG